MANGTAGTKGSSSSAGVNFVQLSNTEGEHLLNSHNDIWQKNPDVAKAISLYASNNNPNGDGFSHAQNLNYKLDNGGTLNAAEAAIDQGLQKGMVALNQNVKLERYCHDDILKQLGISDYTKMSDSELQNAIVGATMTTTSYMSTAYNGSMSPFAPGKSGGGGREVLMKINAKKGTKFAPGDKNQGELILNKGSKIKVKNIYFDGTNAHPQKTYPNPMPRVVLEIEISK